MKKVYILGAGSQARETYQVYIDNGKADEVVGFILTLSGFKKSKLRGKEVINSKVLKKIPAESLLISAVGNPFKRKKLISELKNFSFKYDSIIHKSVIKGSNISVGGGATISAGSVLTCDIKIGRHVLINIGCTISHDAEVGNFATLAPGVHIGGRVRIGERSWVGIGTTVIQDVKIGKRCFIGAGAVVIDNIPDDTLAYGIPAKVIRKIKSSDWSELI